LAVLAIPSGIKKLARKIEAVAASCPTHAPTAATEKTRWLFTHCAAKVKTPKRRRKNPVV